MAFKKTIFKIWLCVFLSGVVFFCELPSYFPIYSYFALQGHHMMVSEKQTIYKSCEQLVLILCPLTVLTLVVLRLLFQLLISLEDASVLRVLPLEAPAFAFSFERLD